MLIAHFVFWEILKAIALIFLALLSIKIISALRIPASRRPRMIRGTLYAVVVILVVAGARVLGYDTAAEVYYRTAQSDLAQRKIELAYSNALRAVELRPADVRYWQTLVQAKIAGRQFRSALEDEAALRALSGGQLDPDEEARFVTCRYFLGQYGEVVRITGQMIQQNRLYPLAYVLQGLAYTALKNYPAAEATFLKVLGLFPTQTDAVAGLAQSYFLAGDTSRALAVLDATRHYDFAAPARKRIDELKAFYAQ
ncbi:MAG TPA: tetratricopeptide repeat protein [Terriglobia bacterium]|nr:tetratricopeptide repeat protein [Terriglobia bacterium]HEX5481470.1 tetratricopeptide repeat protein [Terriglobia bacterium]